jgi:hypothetical protein
MHISGVVELKWAVSLSQDVLFYPMARSRERIDLLLMFKSDMRAGQYKWEEFMK